MCIGEGGEEVGIIGPELRGKVLSYNLADIIESHLKYINFLVLKFVLSFFQCPEDLLPHGC